MYISLTLAFILGTVWLYLSDLHMLWESLLVVTIQLILLGVAILTAVFSLDRKKNRLVAIGKSREIAWTVALVHNSVGMYSTWMYFVTVTQLCAVMVYTWDLDMDISCYACLSLIAIEILAVFIFDNFIWFEKRKHLYTPYVVALMSLAGSLTNYYDLSDPITIYNFVLLLFTLFTLVFKIGWWCGRNKKAKKPQMLVMAAQPKQQRQPQMVVPQPEQMYEVVSGEPTMTTAPQVQPTFIYPSQQLTNTEVPIYTLQQPTTTLHQQPTFLQAPPILHDPSTLHQPILLQQPHAIQQPIPTVYQPHAVFQQPMPTITQQPVIPPAPIPTVQPVITVPDPLPTVPSTQQSTSGRSTPLTTGLYPTLPTMVDTPPDTFSPATARVTRPPLTPFPESRTSFITPDVYPGFGGGVPYPEETRYHPQMAPTMRVPGSPPVYVCGLGPHIQKSPVVVQASPYRIQPNTLDTTGYGPHGHYRI